MERGLSFGSRGPQSDFARLCWRVRIQNNNHQRHATTQGVSHAAVKHPARFRGLRAPHALYCAHQPNSAVKPTPTSSACGCPPCFALRRGLPWPLAPKKTNLFSPCLLKRHSVSQTLCSAGFAVSLGFACWRYAGLWSFWPLALVQQAQAAIVLQALCCFGRAALFRSSCPSPNSSYPFWLLALTFRSSRPAFCGRLTSPVERPLSLAATGWCWPRTAVEPRCVKKPRILRANRSGSDSASPGVLS